MSATVPIVHLEGAGADVARPVDLSRVAGKRVVASISGGKDSTALALWLAEQGIRDVERVFMDTGWEHEATYEYLRGPLTDAIGPIRELKMKMPPIDLAEVKRPLVRAAAEAGNAMVLLCLWKMMFPSRVIRFCTEQLKVLPARDYVASLLAGGVDVVNAVGIRAAESEARSKLSEWEFNDTFDCDVWRPLIRWTEQDVIDIHKRHGLKPNPLYLNGVTRVGCWPCIYARKSELRLIGLDTKRIDLIRELEEELTERARARAEAKGQVLKWERTWFAQGSGRALDELWPIDKAVAWANTSRGGRQFEMFQAAGRDQGCMRWGMCETDKEDE